MKPTRLIIALVALVLPLVVRSLWFYRGIYRPAGVLATPDYAALTVPTPPPAATAQPGPTPAAAPEAVVLLDLAHLNAFAVSEIGALSDILGARRARIEVVESAYGGDSASLDQRLKYASAYVAIAPSTAYSTSEVQELAAFVERGGRLLVVSDPTHTGLSVYDVPGMPGGPIGDVAAANTLLTPFDLAFSDGYLYDLAANDGNFRNVILSRFADVALARGLNKVVLYGARSIATASGVALLQGGTSTFSSLTDAPGSWTAAALSRDGGVLAIGDITLLAHPYDQVADNGVLVARIADFLIGTQRSRTLADFPYVFSRPVAYLLPGSKSVTADDLKTIGDLQAWLRSIGRDLSLATKAPDGADIIVVGLYSPADEMLPFLEPFDLTLPGESPDGTLTVPGLGAISPTGTGLVLLGHTGAQTTLVLMAETADDLRLLESDLSTSGLSGCLIQGNAALCQLGPGAQAGGLDFGSSSLFPEEWMTPEVPPSIFLPTPTPITP